MPVCVVISTGTVADCVVAPKLIEAMEADAVIADKGYDSWAVVDCIASSGAEVVIPLRKNRLDQRVYDRHLYKVRCLVENAFQRFKEWRGVATRYAKRASSFLAAVQFRCIFDWIRIL